MPNWPRRAVFGITASAVKVPYRESVTVWVETGFESESVIFTRTFVPAGVWRSPASCSRKMPFTCTVSPGR